MDAATYRNETQTLTLKELEVLVALSTFQGKPGTSLKTLRESLPTLSGLPGVLKKLRMRGYVTRGRPIGLTECGRDLVEYGKAQAHKSQEEMLAGLERSRKRIERMQALAVSRINSFSSDENRALTPMYWWSEAPVGLLIGYWADSRELGEQIAQERLLAGLDVDGFHEIVLERMLRAGLAQRRSIVSKAIGCHTRADYDISTPIFLIQAEGIARDIVCHFRGTDSKETGDGFISWRQVVNVISAELGESREYLEAFDAQRRLDRDNICHGRSLDYASRWQSFISLMYLYSMVDRYYAALNRRA